MDEEKAGHLLLQALIAAGADQARAHAAAEMFNQLAREFNAIQTDLMLLKATAGLTSAGVIALVLDRIFF